MFLRIFGPLVVIAVVVVAAVPSLRHKVLNESKSIRNTITPAYVKVPVSGVTATGWGHCTPPQLVGNNTSYWYTRALSDGPQMLTVNIDPKFTGKVVRVAFTPLVPAVSAAPTGQASPNPEQLVLTSTPPGTATPITLANPPKFQVVNVSVKGPTQLRLQVTATDPGAAAASCAETGVVFYSKKG